MEFNAKKCFFLNITNKRRIFRRKYKLNNIELENVHSHPYLGVVIDDKLNWNEHVDYVSSKTTKSLNFVKRNLKKTPHATRELAFRTYVRPQLEYATPIWNPSTARNITSLEKVNRRGARFVHDDYRQHSSPTAIIKGLEWNTLQNRRHINDLCFMHKLAHGKLNISLDQILTPLPQRTRSNHRAYKNTFQPSCNAMKNAFFPRVVPSWNRLPPTLVDIPDTKTFRAKLSQHLGCHPHNAMARGVSN